MDHPKITEFYSFVDKSLEGPLIYADFEKRVALLKEAEREMQEFNKRPLKGMAHLQALKDGISDQLKLRPRTVGERRDELQRLSMQHRAAVLKRSRGPLYADGRDFEAISRILLLYTRFENKTLEADFAHVFGIEIAEDEANQVDEAHEIQKRINRHKQWICNNWDERQVDVSEFFIGGNVPRNFAGRSWKSHSEWQMTDIIFKQMLHDYRLRAKWYTVPVTINCVAIAALPEPHQKRWTELYDRAGCTTGEYAKFKSFECTIRGDDDDSVDFSDAPEFFLKDVK